MTTLTLLIFMGQASATRFNIAAGAGMNITKMLFAEVRWARGSGEDYCVSEH